ncbi:MAG: tetratricopeptide repeat protein, partial [Planctomycetota bacterium]
SDLGRPEAALAAEEEAVAIRRRLAAARPDAFEPGLAISLSNLGIRLSALWRPEAALAAAEEAVAIRRRLAADRGLELRLNTIDASQLTETIDALSERVSGGAISDDEASEYASASLAALRDLAIAGNAALNVADAAGSLIAALDETSGQTRLDVAEVLAHIGQDRTQVALAEAALDAGGREQVDLLAKVADAARRFGNLIEDRQVRRLTELAQRGDGDNATAAAAVLGSLGLRGFDLVPLLIGDAGQPARRLGAR